MIMIRHILLIVCLLYATFAVKVSLVKVEDIEYWDIDSWKDMSNEERVSTKQTIVNQLNTDLKLLSDDGDVKDHGQEAVALDACACPRIYGPVICDSKGNSHSNTCIFACSKINDPELTPKKIFVAIDSNLDPEKLCKLNV